MKWWLKALIGSLVWAALTIGAGILHTNVVLAGVITAEQDAAISERYGMACGGGLVLLWAGAFLLRSRA